MTASYYENHPVAVGTYTAVFSTRNLMFVPFVLPFSVSMSAIRMPVSYQHVTTTQTGESANTTWTVQNTNIAVVVMYSQGTGASSNSLMSMFSAGGTHVHQCIVQNGANSSEYSVTQNITFPITPNGVSTLSASYAVSSSRYNLSSDLLTDINGYRLLDIPVSRSMSPGNYWLGIGNSFDSTINGGPAMNAPKMRIPNFGQSVNVITINHFGVDTNVTDQLAPGWGSFSTTNTIASLSAIDLSQISGVAAGFSPIFQLINRA